jgi:hypothetical protein
MQTQLAWQPDESLFESVDGIARGIRLVKEALEHVGLSTDQIITSKHPSLGRLKEQLKCAGLPAGFEQHVVPVLLLGKDALSFITTGQPNAAFPEHRHLQNDGIRVVTSGSIIYQGVELNPGDWMFVPRGASYSFTVGSKGCILYHNYPQYPPG